MYLSKGQLVDVEGRLQTRQWDDDAGKRHFVATVGEHQSVVTTQADWRAVRLLTVFVCVVVISSGCGARTLPVAPPAARA